MSVGAVQAPRLAGRDMISVRDFTREEILFILGVARQFEQERRPLLQGKVLATLFYEPSTRTRLSFESAMTRLGGSYLGFADMRVSSTTKGESLQDTIRVVEGYCDIILIRHPVEGAARLAAETTKLPVVNGGDGANQHPTQTLLDLYTIRESRGRLEGLKVAFLGDLKYGRTVHSLIEVLAKFGNLFSLIAPPGLGLPRDLLEDLDEAHVQYEAAETLSALDPGVDVIYTTRIQKERFPDALEYERVQNTYHLDRAAISRFRDDVTIMHPLPRVTEIDPELDAHPGSAYFLQARNGVTVRKAILSLLLGVYDGA
ncbi:MAG: aspartate carbamoyltransferase [Planctomycetota bacterium]